MPSKCYELFQIQLKHALVAHWKHKGIDSNANSPMVGNKLMKQFISLNRNLII